MTDSKWVAFPLFALLSLACTLASFAAGVSQIGAWLAGFGLGLAVVLWWLRPHAEA